MQRQQFEQNRLGVCVTVFGEQRASVGQPAQDRLGCGRCTLSKRGDRLFAVAQALEQGTETKVGHGE
jgi:hypothetical protein